MKPCDECVIKNTDACPTGCAFRNKPCDDTVSRGVFEQVMWERDTAIEQLRKLGYELGQKIEPCDDAVSREEAIMCLTGINLPTDTDKLIALYNERIKALPPVLPKREENTAYEKYVLEQNMQALK